VRRWLYFAALRAVQSPAVRRWHEAKKARDGGHGGKSIVAVMRKLALALYRVGVDGERYDASRLFPGRPLARVAEETLCSGSTKGDAPSALAALDPRS
jgi:hypothetical protein